MKTELGLQERLLILNILPQKGNIVNLRVTKDIVKNVGLSDKEIQEWEVKVLPDGKVSWNLDKVEAKEIIFGDTAKGIIKDELKKLNEKNELPMNYLELYEKFDKE